MKPFLSSVHGTIHLVSRVSSPWNDRLLRDQPDECWVNPTYEDWPQTKQLRSFRNTLMHFSSIFNAFVITFRPWGDRVNTVISALRQVDGPIDGHLPPNLRSWSFSWSDVPTLSLCLHQIIINPAYFPGNSNCFLDSWWILTICACGTHCHMSGPFYIWRIWAAWSKTVTSSQEWESSPTVTLNLLVLAIPLLWTEGGSSKFLLRCWSSAGY